MKVAAKKGSLYAHTRLAGFYGMSINWNEHKLIKHTTVAANAGCKIAMDALMKFYREKMLSKEELTQTLHAFQAASNETKSREREAALIFERKLPPRLHRPP